MEGSGRHILPRAKAHIVSAPDSGRAKRAGVPPYVKPLFLVAAAATTGIAAFAAYESAAMDLPLVREEPALFTPFHLARSAFALVVSGLIAWTIYTGQSRDCRLDRRGMGWKAMLASLVAAGAALLFTGIFLASPETFGALAEEDSGLEWASAILLFAGGGLFAADAVRRTRRPEQGAVAGAALAAAFALLLFLIAMEEISWMQRLFGFGTPQRLAEMNWQGEFNLHNLQTDLSETLYYVGAATFLMLLPLAREASPDGVLPRPVMDFLPDRRVAALSAPVAIFNYGHWNLIPIQITTMAGILVLLAWSAAAARRGDGAERILFLVLAGSVAAGQAAFLALGHRMTEVPNATEFKEFFIALGLAAFALNLFARRSSA